MPRSFRNLAEAMNGRAWERVPLPAPSSPAHAKYEADCIESAHRSQEAWLWRRRNRLADRIMDTIDFPAGFYRSVYFRDLTGAVALSTDEAVAELRREIAREKLRKGHWSHRPERIEGLREAMVYARFFRRHGARVWQREAA